MSNDMLWCVIQLLDIIPISVVIISYQILVLFEGFYICSQDFQGGGSIDLPSELVLWLEVKI